MSPYLIEDDYQIPIEGFVSEMSNPSWQQRIIKTRTDAIPDEVKIDPTKIQEETQKIREEFDTQMADNLLSLQDEYLDMRIDDYVQQMGYKIDDKQREHIKKYTHDYEHWVSVNAQVESFFVHEIGNHGYTINSIMLGAIDGCIKCNELIHWGEELKDAIKKDDPSNDERYEYMKNFKKLEV